MKKKMKNKLDEMQEQKMLKIEHNGCWFAFWGLLVALFIQVLVYGFKSSWRYIAGEWIVFMCLALYITIDCIRNGVWDRHLSPTPTVNICASAIGGVIVGIFNATSSYRDYHILARAYTTGIASGIMVSALCFAALTCTSSLYKKRVKHLEQEAADEEDHD